MKNLILTLSLFVVVSVFAQPQSNDIDNFNTVTDEESSFDFNTKDYLPLGFDPYEGMFIDDSTLLMEKPVKFNFNTKDFLPDDFDAYKGMFLNNTTLNEEAAVPFEFDTTKYLPKNFDPYKRSDENTVSAS